MNLARKMPRLATLAAIAAIPVTSSLAQATGPWTLSGSVGYADAYRHRTDRNGDFAGDATFGATGTWMLAVDRHLAGPWSLRATAGKLHYRQPYSFAYPADDQIYPFLPPGHLDARFLPVGLGLRWQPEQGLTRVTPWLTVAPLALFGRWSETDFFHDDRFDRVLPGWTAGGGLSFAISELARFDAGVSWLDSADPHHVSALPGGGTRTFHGLSQAIYSVGFSVTP